MPHPQERKHQKIAFADCSTIDWWFRKTFNLAPTDVRYLKATEEIMWVEYWLHVFDERWAIARKEGIKIEGIEDLLSLEGMSDEEFYRQLEELNKKDAEEELQKPKSPDSHVALARNGKAAEPEVVIRFKHP